MLGVFRGVSWTYARRPLACWKCRQLRTRSTTITTLAIETSCDDTSVAVVSVDSDNVANGRSGPRSIDFAKCRVHFHRTITARSEEYQGIHPVVALHSHQTSLGKLVIEARKYLQRDRVFHAPTFVAATRGPGMRSSLTIGLTMAKGLAAAWNVPFVGVHHMQAHALTPRLCSVIDDGPGALLDGKTVAQTEHEQVAPRFPYLTVLASGGHTMLLRSTSLTEHDILASTHDIAIGDCLDKAARAILPPDLLTVPYGRALEQFAFPNGSRDYQYDPPLNRRAELARHATEWNWSLSPPLASSGKDDKSTRRMMFSFSGLLSSVERLVENHVASDGSHTTVERSGEKVSIEERREMARQVLRLTFEHLVSRILLYFQDYDDQEVDTIVVSGGVAANRYLRHVLRQLLDARGLSRIKINFPPIELCTDNALMIAWAGIEMFKAGYTSSLDVVPLRKWSMDSTSDDGGILGVPGWINHNDSR